MVGGFGEDPGQDRPESDKAEAVEVCTTCGGTGEILHGERIPCPSCVEGPHSILATDPAKLKGQDAEDYLDARSKLGV